MQDTPINKRFIFKGRGQHFPLAVSSSYDEVFPKQLRGVMPESGFQLHIDRINDVARRYWPCCTAYILGIGCCPFTFGLSCLIPRVCLSDAEAMIRRRVAQANQEFFYRHGWQMQLHVGWCSSHLLLKEKQQKFGVQDVLSPRLLVI